MKKIIVSIVMAAALIAVAGCAKRDTIGPNDANKRYLEAWMSLNYPGLEPTGLGIYVIEQEDGTGVEVKEDGYVLLDYVTTDIHGNITAYTGEETAKQVGEYSVTNYYGPKFSSTFEGGLPAGLIDAPSRLCSSRPSATVRHSETDASLILIARQQCGLLL